MEKYQKKIAEIYQTKFDTKCYVEKYYGVIGKDRKQISKKLHQIFHSGKINGKSYLDFGCGPCVSWLIPASYQFDDITCCEYMNDNIVSLKKWLMNDKDATDWSIWFEFFAQLEGKSKNELESRVRNSVHRVLPCDVYNKNPIHPEEKVFDVIFTAFCLESAITKKEHYHVAIENLSRLLRPGGTFIQVGVIGCSDYNVGQNQLPVLTFDKKLLCDTLEYNGFNDINFEILPREEFVYNNNNAYDAYFTLTAQKDRGSLN